MDFPGNSHKEIEGLGVPKKEPKKEKPKTEKVVTSTPVKKKNSLGKRFKDLFFNGDFKGAVNYITRDVMLPAIKNMAVDATTQGIERVIYGDVRPRQTRRADLSRPLVSYDRMSRSRGAMLPDQPPHHTQKQRQHVAEVVIPTKAEADLVLERMCDIIDTYDVASVADFWELLGFPISYTDNNWGWASLISAKVRQTREGFVLDLPPAEPIKN